MSATIMVLNLAFSRAILGWLLDFFLAFYILIGWFVVYLTECHVNLICAWLVSLCDIMFLANSLGKWSDRSLQMLRRLLLFASETQTMPRARMAAEKASQYGLLLQIINPLAFIPYHILFILDLDGPRLYAMICLLRLLWIARTQRVSISFFSDYTRIKILRFAWDSRLAYKSAVIAG